jgi:phage shock protein A
MADPDTDSSDALQRAKQAQVQSKALREQMAQVAESVAEVEEDVARVHRRLADQGGPIGRRGHEARRLG